VTDTRHAVLELLLDHHPGLLSTDEVIGELTAGSGAFTDRDQIEVAVRDLAGAGLVNRVDRFVFASHAAASFRELETT
jgi:Fe2+ or Zn2+ uptake regulation protein